MAIYTHKEIANSPATYWGDAMGSNYSATAGLITIVNSDTTLTKAHGAFAIVNGAIVGGTITSLERTSANGLVVYETLTDFTRNAVSFLNNPADEKLEWIMWKSTDTLTGYSGDDYLDGYDDILAQTHPIDTMIGGKGNDTYIVKHEFDNVIEKEDEGFDTIKTYMNDFTLPAHVEKLVKESATPFHGVGNELDNTLIDMAGSEVHLEGLDGNDTFYIDATIGWAKGGTGNDTYYIYDTYGDYTSAIEKAGEGTDKVFTSIDGYSLSDNIEELHLTGNVGITAYSNATGAKIFGTDKSDSLIGGDGDDTFHGQGGTNTLVGGKGNDTYYIESATDYAAEAVNEGTDTVKTTLTTWKLMPNLEQLIFLSGPGVGRVGTGNDLSNYILGAEKADSLYGLGGGDYIDGGAGADHLEGGQGDDTYYVDNAGDVIVELAGEGDDDVQATSANYTLSANVETLWFKNAISHVGHGNDIDNKFIGVNASDTFYGYAGDDEFFATGGGDVFFGGTGNDKYWVAAGDSVVEAANEGIDTVWSLATKVTLSANVENLNQTANNGIGIGNDLENDMKLSASGAELHGRGGNDTLRMFGSNKLMDGGDGDDTLVVNGSLSYYALQDVGGGKILMVNSYGTNTVIDIEHIQFTDGTLHLNDNPLFDTAYYMSHNLDVWNAGANALDHFNTSGWHEGRDPNAWFDSSGYLAVNKDVAASGQNPLEHYHNTGWQQGRDPGADFDTTLYLINNPDVAASGIDPLQHFLETGQAEGRQAYQAVGQNIVGGFDAQYYLLHNPDVAAAGVDPLQHFNQSGWHEGRNPNGWFDTSGYLAHYSDVAASGVNPLQHYEQFGWHEGRDPSAQFDTLGYVAANGDVAAAGANPLDHFLSNGIYEGRSAMGDGLWH